MSVEALEKNDTGGSPLTIGVRGLICGIAAECYRVPEDVSVYEGLFEFRDEFVSVGRTGARNRDLALTVESTTASCLQYVGIGPSNNPEFGDEASYIVGFQFGDLARNCKGVGHIRQDCYGRDELHDGTGDRWG